MSVVLDRCRSGAQLGAGAMPAHKRDADELAARKHVRKATKLRDPLSALSDENACRCSLADGVPLSLHSCYGTCVPADDFDWAFTLFTGNMRDSYARSDWGWDEKSKRAELQAATSRWIIARRPADSQTQPPAGTATAANVAFVHYRFDMDAGSPVLYCYEIQVERDYQRRGVGASLVTLLVTMAHRAHMKKVMATVFKSNVQSMRFFEKLQFTPDEDTNEEDRDYVILSRIL